MRHKANGLAGRRSAKFVRNEVTDCSWRVVFRGKSEREGFVFKRRLNE